MKVSLTQHKYAFSMLQFGLALFHIQNMFSFNHTCAFYTSNNRADGGEYQMKDKNDKSKMVLAGGSVMCLKHVL